MVAYTYSSEDCSTLNSDYVTLVDNTDYIPSEDSETCGWMVDYFYTGETGIFFVINTDNAVNYAATSLLLIYLLG